MARDTAQTPRLVVVYEEIAETLRSAIKRGQYRPGDRLPSLNGIIDDPRFAALAEPGTKLSQATVQAAYKMLEDEGLVVAIPRRGYFVREALAIRYRMNLATDPDLLIKSPVDTWEDEAHAAGYSARQDISVGVVRRNHPVDIYTIGDLLDLGVGQNALVRRRRRYIGESPSAPASQPESLCDSYYPQHIAEDTPLADETTTNTIRALADLGHMLVRWRLEILTRPPNRDEAADLRLPRATPIMEHIGIAYGPGDDPILVQHARTAGNGSRWVFDMSYPRDE